jgi:hypothetical protein
MGKVKMKLDAAMIKERLRATKLRYHTIEEISGGQITVRRLKYYMSQKQLADEDTVRLLAQILECDENDLIDKEELIAENIPGEINILVAKLYERKKEDIQVVYKQRIANLRDQWELRKMLQASHRLFMVFASEDIDFDRGLIIEAMDIVISTLKESTFICNQKFTGLTMEFYNQLIKLIAEGNDGHYHPQMAVLIFLYVYIIFDAVFLEELICSALELMPQRANNKALQYLALAAISEKIRFTLIEKIVHQGYSLQDDDAEKSGISDLFVSGIVLMLAACEKCHKHIEGEYVASEYVNRATFGAILNKLKKILMDADIEIPAPTSWDTLGSRFSVTYHEFKAFFNALNPTQKPKNYSDGYQDGMNAAIGGMLLGHTFKQV